MFPKNEKTKKTILIFTFGTVHQEASTISFGLQAVLGEEYSVHHAICADLKEIVHLSQWLIDEWDSFALFIIYTRNERGPEFVEVLRYLADQERNVSIPIVISSWSTKLVEAGVGKGANLGVESHYYFDKPEWVEKNIRPLLEGRSTQDERVEPGELEDDHVTHST